MPPPIHPSLSIGTRLSVEFYNDDSQQGTTWYKQTVISYSRQQGYVITFDGLGPEENEHIKCLRKAFEKKRSDFCRHIYHIAGKFGEFGESQTIRQTKTIQINTYY